MPGSSNSCTFGHNSGANATHTKSKIFVKISPEHNLARDAGDFFVFKNHCTLLTIDRSYCLTCVLVPYRRWCGSRMSLSPEKHVLAGVLVNLEAQHTVMAS
jgi:hypothetical protein